MTCAVEWRNTWRPSSLSPVMIATVAPSGSGRPRSHSSPSTTAATAALASREPIDSATVVAVAPCARERCEPSGSVIVMSAIGPQVYEGIDGGPRPLHRLPMGCAYWQATTDRRLLAGHGADEVGLVIRDVGHLRQHGGLRIGSLAGVGVAVVLSGEVANLVHQLVGDLAQHHVVIGTVAVSLDVDGTADLDGTI